MNKYIGEKNGLVFCGVNEEGENEFIGTDAQWSKAEKEQEEYDRMVDGEIEEMKEEDLLEDIYRDEDYNDDKQYY